MYLGEDLCDVDRTSLSDQNNETETDGVHDSAHRKRLATANKRCFDADSVTINCDGRDGLLYVLGRDNVRLNKWRVERGALIFPDWSKGEIILGGKDDVRKELRNEIYELIEEKDVSEFYVPQVVNMSFLVGHNCKNLKRIEDKTNTFLRPKGSHKTIMIAGQDRASREYAKKMLKELCGDVLYPSASSHVLINGNVPRTATVVFMDKDFGYIPPLATGRHAKVLGIEEGQAFLEDTEENKLSLSEPYTTEHDGALQQARPLGSLLQTNTEFIQQCLFHFLNEVRPHKGLITLKGSYGKMMFLDLSEDISSVCWSIEEFAYQSMLFNLKTTFSPRCDLMEENISDKLGGTLEECNIKYEFAMIDKAPKDKNRCRNVLLTAKYLNEEEGEHRFEILQVSSNDNKQKEFTRAGDLNPNRTERFCANIACVDRKVDLQINVECRHVIQHDNYSSFVERLAMMTDENSPSSNTLAYELDQNQTVLSVNKIAETVIALGSIKIVICSVSRGTVNRDNCVVKFEAVPYTKIDVCSKVWEGAFNQNVLAAYDEAGTTKMTWSAEQLLMKDLEDFMNVAQNASKYVKPE